LWNSADKILDLFAEATMEAEVDARVFLGRSEWAA
jgi:hypothetical protein